MASEFDLEAYFARIGFSGVAAPSLETLAAIHRCHAEAIPFENLDPLLGRPVRLDIASIARKIIQGGRGGYCYEHNRLLSCALEEIGFKLTCLAARVLWNYPPGTIGPRNHMLLLIELDGAEFVADAGFGGQTLTAPLRLEADVEQWTPHGLFRLVRGPGRFPTFEMQARIGEDWKSLYRFDMQEQFPADYEVPSWYLSNHPNSPFVTTLMVARPGEACRYTLRNSQFAIHHVNRGTEESILAGAAELRSALENVFRIALPDTEGLDQALSRIAAPPAIAPG